MRKTLLTGSPKTKTDALTFAVWRNSHFCFFTNAKCAILKYSHNQPCRNIWDTVIERHKSWKTFGVLPTPSTNVFVIPWWRLKQHFFPSISLFDLLFF